MTQTLDIAGKKPTSQPINHSTKKKVCQSTNQPINQSKMKKKTLIAFYYIGYYRKKDHPINQLTKRKSKT